jgi:pimeloyl-ACP methyl ester carboxylesterase
MSILRLLGGDSELAQYHVIFFHGLNGSIDGTWTVNVSGEKEFWPLWLIEDVAEVAIWAVEYDAAISSWAGHALPLEDRGQNIWHHLRDEPRLQRGNIAFVGHSMGGLVAIQTLRCIDRDRADKDAEEFGQRVRRIAFLGTPHRGSRLASSLSRIAPLLPTQAIRDLQSGTPQLRDLSGWFRKHVDDNQILTLGLAEGLRTGFFAKLSATVVTPESADAGLVDIPTIVDETHLTINKPLSRENQVYKAIRAFLQRHHDGRAAQTRVSAAVGAIEAKVDVGRSASEEGHRLTHDAIAQLSSQIPFAGPRDTRTLDEALDKKLERLLQRRLFPQVDAVAEARALLSDTEHGEFMVASLVYRHKVIAWCARIIAPSEPAEAGTILDRHANLKGELATIATFRMRAAEGDLEAGLSKMATYKTATARGASYLALLHHRSLEEAIEWLSKTEIDPLDLDDGALFTHLAQLHKAGQWQDSFDLAQRIDVLRLECSAALNGVVAGIYLAGAIPDARFDIVDRTQLLGMDSLPLKDDPQSLDLRRTASKCYSRLAGLLGELDLQSMARISADWCLWLDLHDPDTKEDARLKLAESLADKDALLRRFLWAKECGIKVDLDAVDREIERQVALTGGAHFEHAAARFAMAMARDKPIDGVKYVERHRDHLLKHLDATLVLGVEVELLARSGETTRARTRLLEAEKASIDPAISARLHALIDQAEGDDGVLEKLQTNFDHSGSILDHRALVFAYAERGAHTEVRELGKSLLERSADARDARVVAIALYESGQQDDSLKLFDDYPVLMQEPKMRLLHARALFELGKLREATEVLTTLRIENDDQAARALHLQLTIAMGNWAALQAFVEAQWIQRDDRSAVELLQAGQLAQFIGASRGETLVRCAANEAPDNPYILSACYYAASSAGWENDVTVSSWIGKAAELSENAEAEGPVQRASLDQIVKWMPAWEEKEARILEQAVRGELPLFLVAKSLNRTLTQMVISQALWNVGQPDVRKKAMLLTTSGKSRSVPENPRTVALDPVALLTMSMTGSLDACRKTFDKIFVAHETLAWLFDERTQLRFHQPSQVHAARALQRSVTDGTVRVHEASIALPEGLFREVGRTLAELLTEAATNNEDGREKIVVVGGPIWKVGSVMSVEAELGDYAHYVRSTADIVEALSQRGVLSAGTIAAARRVHKQGEEVEANSVPNNAVLLLDDTAASLLSQSNLLSPLRQAGFDVVIPTSEMEEARQLIEHDARAEDTLAIVEKLRAWLELGIQEGWIQLGRAVRPDGENNSSWFTHPSAATARLTGDIDACVFDDRFVNSHMSMASMQGAIPILTSWSLLDILRSKGSISKSDWSEARTTLRQAAYTLAPVDKDELSELVGGAAVKDGILIETAELRALRESVMRVRMSDVLQLPLEAQWLDTITTCCLQVLSEVWNSGGNPANARARSEWLLGLGDPACWAHQMGADNEPFELARRTWLLMLTMLVVGRENDVAGPYGDWLEDRVLASLKEEEPTLFAQVVADVKAHTNALVSHLLEVDSTKEVTNGN